MPRRKHVERPEPARRGIELLTANQEKAWRLMHEKSIVFLTGTTGTGKTYLATAFAINAILCGHVKRLVMTRPGVTADNEDWGALPGELNEKLQPFLVPIYQTIEKIVGDNKKTKLELHAATELAPLAFCRGRTFDNCVAILDEAQNVTSSQLKMWLTRIGTGGKLFICGDPEQNDLGQSPLANWVQGLEHIDRVGVVRFDEADIVRDEDGLIREILQASRNL